MPVETVEGKVTLHHPKGSSVEILLYGATVVSWKAGPSLEERLFVSSIASIDGSKPVRGGIPVVFPCFGAPTHPEHNKLRQHGFGRSEVWKLVDILLDNQTSIAVKFSLEPNPSISAVYPREFLLNYVVTLSDDELNTELHVNNPSTEALEFQALFHNYIRASADSVLISPLQNLSYLDKVDTDGAGQPLLKTETRSAVDVQRLTDRVYQDAPQVYNISWPEGGLNLKTHGLKDVVVWNPQEVAGRKIVDMEEGGWKRFVCVEPGYVAGFVKLEGGASWVGRQSLIIVT